MSKITKKGNHIFVPDHVTIPYIEGDGVGHEITPVSQKIVNAAIKQAYNGTRSIEWKEVLAGEKAFKQTGSWLPDETMEAFREYIVGIKGPLTTPIGGGIRSLNVALRQRFARLKIFQSDDRDMVLLADLAVILLIGESQC